MGCSLCKLMCHFSFIWSILFIYVHVYILICRCNVMLFKFSFIIFICYIIYIIYTIFIYTYILIILYWVHNNITIVFEYYNICKMSWCINKFDGFNHITTINCVCNYMLLNYYCVYMYVFYGHKLILLRARFINKQLYKEIKIHPGPNWSVGGFTG